MKKTKGKLSFKPVLSAKLTRTASLEVQFEVALHGADHVTVTESPQMIIFKLRKRTGR